MVESLGFVFSLQVFPGPCKLGRAKGPLESDRLSENSRFLGIIL